jgi:hypothetical protein
MLAPDLINDKVETKFRAAEVLVSRWNLKHAPSPLPPLLSEEDGWLPNKKRRSRKHEKQR